MIAGAIEVEVAGEAAVLLAQRGVYLPARRVLLVADLHLGKVDAARAEGSPLSGVVAAAMREKHLERLGSAIEACGAERVIVLGDLLHAPVGLSPALVEGVAAWRKTVGAAIDVVPGNHDRRLERVADGWGMGVLEPRVRLGGFELVHDPAMATGDAYAWCGHLHPAVQLASGGDALRLPAFHLKQYMGVLPAFTTMAAGKQMRVDDGDRVFAAANDRVVEIGKAAKQRSEKAPNITVRSHSRI